MLLHQVFSFNSPVWFNVGTPSPQQVSACFILAVDDSMDSILDWYKEEGLIFKGGSGSGSTCPASGPPRSCSPPAAPPPARSASCAAPTPRAGTIKSGGATRRAAKMVILDVDHPDIEEFIETKAREEDKIRALRDAGFDMDLGGKDIVQRPVPERQQLGPGLRRVHARGRGRRPVRPARPGSTARSSRPSTPRGLFRKIAQAAWECADPGIQYDDTINDWHTMPGDRPDHRVQPLLGVPAPGQLVVQPGLAQPDEVPPRRRQLRGRDVRQVVELVITAMDISICFADFPTEKIGETTRAYRQLGIGYANLGALLMASGLPYDSEGGRVARRGDHLADDRHGLPPLGRAGRRRRPVRRLRPQRRAAQAGHAQARRRQRRDQADGAVATAIVREATKQWQSGIKIGEKNGWRNAQARVLAPTGCLTADTLVTTDRGLMRLGEIGDVYGDRWQDLDMQRLHRRGAAAGDEVLRQRRGADPPHRHRGRLPDPGHARPPDQGRRPAAPARGSGSGWPTSPPATSCRCSSARSSASPGGCRCPCSTRPTTPATAGCTCPDAVDARPRRARRLLHGRRQPARQGHPALRRRHRPRCRRARSGCSARACSASSRSSRAGEGYHEVTLQSVRLARWWQAAGLRQGLCPASTTPARAGRRGCPSAILETNDVDGLRRVPARPVRGRRLGARPACRALSTASESFAAEVRTVLLALGHRHHHPADGQRLGAATSDQVRLRNLDHAMAFDEIVGFIGERKTGLLAARAGADR